MKYLVVLLIGVSLWACKVPTISTNDEGQFALSQEEQGHLHKHSKINLSVQGQKEEAVLLKSLSSKKIRSLKLSFRQNPTLDPSVLEYLNFTSPMIVSWQVGLDVKTNEAFDKALMKRINPSRVYLDYNFKSLHLIDLFIQELPKYKALRTLWLSNLNSHFPKTYSQQQNLEKLLDILLLEKKIKNWRIGIENLDSIPYRIGRLKNLNLLSITYGGFKGLPSSIGQLTKLTSLILKNNKALKELPESIGNLNQLDQLYISQNQLTELPSSLGKLKKLHTFHAIENQLKTIGSYIGELKQLEDLRLSGNQLKTLPDEIQNLKKLTELHLLDNPISKEEQERIKTLLPNTTIYF